MLIKFILTILIIACFNKLTFSQVKKKLPSNFRLGNKVLIWQGEMDGSKTCWEIYYKNNIVSLFYTYEAIDNRLLIQRCILESTNSIYSSSEVPENHQKGHAQYNYSVLAATNGKDATLSDLPLPKNAKMFSIKASFNGDLMAYYSLKDKSKKGSSGKVSGKFLGIIYDIENSKIISRVDLGSCIIIPSSSDALIQFSAPYFKEKKVIFPGNNKRCDFFNVEVNFD